MRLVEVGPRDGLQNEKATVPTDVKVALIDRLTDAGFPAIEATSFVSPKWVPQMADAADVMARIRRKAGVRYPVLTPNLKGFEAALAANADEVAVFVAAIGDLLAEEHQLLDRREPRARAAGVRRGARRTACACAATSRACSAARTKATSIRAKVARRRGRAASRWAPTRSRSATRSASAPPGKTQALDRDGRASASRSARSPGISTTPTARRSTNVYAALEMGVATFDCSVAGLGGCPYAKGATGNVASEDVALPAATGSASRPAST